MDPFVRELTHLIPYVHACARQIARNNQEAEDLAQDALTCAFSRRASYQSALPMKPWLAGIVRNCRRDTLRTRTRRVHTCTFEEEMEVEGRSGGQLESVVLHEVLATIGHLPEPQQNAFMSFIFGGESCEEIAARFNVKTGTIRSRINRAREHLASMFAVA